MTKAEARQLMIEAFGAGFAASGEGYNGEWWPKHDTTVYVGNSTVPHSLVEEAQKFAEERLRGWKTR